MNGVIELSDERTDLVTAAAIAVVDDTLRQIRTQAIFTRAEAQLILRKVAGSVGNTAAVDVLECADADFERDRLISRSRLVDALLDVRLLLLADARLTTGEGASR